MLQIEENKFNKIDKKLKSRFVGIDKKIKKALRQLKSYPISELDDFFVSLERIISLEDKSNDSFVMADLRTVQEIVLMEFSEINFQRSLLVHDKTVIGLTQIISDATKTKEQKEDATKILSETIELNSYLDSIFKYETRKDRLILYYSELEACNCHYCLAQYTTIYSGSYKKYLKGNLDHIYPKSQNALISVSLNNLVPVCAHCNQRKLDALLDKFNFNPFEKIALDKIPTFNFREVLEVDNGKVSVRSLEKLKIDNINETLDKRIELTLLYKEYKSSIINLLNRYIKFNSSSYQIQIQKIIDSERISGITINLEYFISEVPYTKENIQHIPLHKFKSDFYKDLEEYKKNGETF